MQEPSTSEVNKKVRQAIKREGKFDALRKKALSNMSSDGFMENLEQDIKNLVADLLYNLPPHCSKEQLRNRIRERINQMRYHNKIQAKVWSEVRMDWLKDELEEDIRKKVRVEYCLPETLNGENDEEHNDQEEDLDVTSI